MAALRQRLTLLKDNEVPDQSNANGPIVARHLQDIVHREDSTRPVTMGLDRFDDEFKYGIANVLDIPGFNYKPHRYAEALAKLPQVFLLGSETASTVSSRGVYKFPVTQAKQKQYPDNQSSSYDLEAYVCSQTPDEEFASQDAIPNVMVCLHQLPLGRVVRERPEPGPPDQSAFRPAPGPLPPDVERREIRAPAALK